MLLKPTLSAMNNNKSWRTLFALFFPLILICALGLIIEMAYTSWHLQKAAEYSDQLSRKNLATMARIKSEYKTSMLFEKHVMKLVEKCRHKSAEPFSQVFSDAFSQAEKQLPASISVHMQTWAFSREGRDFVSIDNDMLAKGKKRAMERVFAALVRLSQQSQSENAARKDERFISGVFGENSVPEYLATYRLNRLTPVIYEGRQHYIFWHRSGSAHECKGGFISLVDGMKIENDIVALQILSDDLYHQSNGNSKIFFATPQAIVSDKPFVFPQALASDNFELQVYQAMTRDILTEKKESLRKLIMKEKTSVYADSIANDSPYYAFILEKTEFSAKKPVGVIFSAFFSLFWLLIYALKTSKGGISLGFTFRLLFFMTGILPVAMLGIFGFNLLSENREAEISELIKQTNQNFDAINDKSSELKMFAGVLLKEIFSRKDIQRFLIADNKASVERGYALIGEHMARYGFEPGYMMIFRPGLEHFFLSTTGEYDAVARYHQEYFAMSTFSLHDWISRFIADFTPLHLTPAQDNLFKAFNNSKNDTAKNIFLDSLDRISSFEGTDQNDNLLFSSILTNQQHIAAYTVLNVNINKTIRNMVTESIRSLESGDQNNYILLSRNNQQTDLIWPDQQNSYVGSASGQALMDFLRNAASSDFPMQLRSPDSVFLYNPCIKLKALFCGVELDLSLINAHYSMRIKFLTILIAVMAGMIYIVSSSIAVLMIEPTLKLTDVYQSLAQGSFSMSFNYAYHNELGQLAKVTESMISGLKQRKLLGKFVSTTFDSNVIDSTEIAGAKEISGTVLFSDIRSFTTISEMNPAEKIGKMLNAHLKAMVDQINYNGGHIEQFIGDAIVAFFPGSIEASGKKALKAAAMMRQVHNARMRDPELNEISFEIGMGLESGQVMAGTVKAGRRSEYVVIGQAREEAEKLEALSRSGRFTRILVGQQLHDYLSADSPAGFSLCEGYQELISAEVES